MAEAVVQSEIVDGELIHSLMTIFPDAAPDYLKGLCHGRKFSKKRLNKLVSDVLNTSYPKRLPNSPIGKLSFTEQLNILEEMLPKADPAYLKERLETLIDNPDDIKEFMYDALMNNNYPTAQDSLIKQKISAQVKSYTDGFDIQTFLLQIPNPIKYFEETTSKKLTNYSNLCYVQGVIRNVYDMIPMKEIYKLLNAYTDTIKDVFNKAEALQNDPTKQLKRRRKFEENIYTIEDIPFLQEVAFYQHKTEIQKYLTEKSENEEKLFNQYKLEGLLKTCICCYNDEIMPNDSITCEMGCILCKSCIKTSTEIFFSEGKLDFPCIGNCSSQYDLKTLQVVLEPKIFSKIAQKKQLAEVKSAGLEDLEFCPFCDFASIPPTGDKLFRCLNADCMKESCRECKQPSHIPLRCDEVELDEEVKARTYIENKMTEALLRNCYKCGIKFFKADGCNKMQCSCGALMCYICKEPIQDYHHFNDNSNIQDKKCPLYSDTTKLHEEAVMKMAIEAKTEIAETTNIKVDLVADTKTYFDEFRKKYPFQMLNEKELQEELEDNLYAEQLYTVEIQSLQKLLTDTNTPIERKTELQKRIVKKESNRNNVVARKNHLMRYIENFTRDHETH